MAETDGFSPPSFDRAYVISDLHIGGERGFQMFSSAEQFEALIEHILNQVPARRGVRKALRTLLVINGDFVDFLAEPHAQELNFTSAPRMLRNIFERGEFAPVLKALQKFVKSDGARLVMTLGNHDIELALPATRRTLMELLTNGQSELERNIEFCFEGWGYRFQVGGTHALCLHGNESDEFNFTRYDELDRVIHELQFVGKSDFTAQCRPSAGSWFVVHAINPIKQDYPFIDLLKPELPLAATTLVALDPTKLEYADEAVRLKTRAIENERQRPDSQRRMLSVPGLGKARAALDTAAVGVPSATAEDIERVSERALAEGTIDQLIYDSSGRRLLGVSDWLASLRDVVAGAGSNLAKLGAAAVKSLKGAAQAAHREALRRVLLPLVTDDPYRPDILDDADRAVEQGIQGAYDVVFAGHTHFRRIARRPNRTGIHVNTGTWAGLMSLTRSQVRDAEFSTIYAALMEGTRAALKDLIREECTVARMVPAAGSNQVEVSLGGVSKADDGTCTVNFPDTQPLSLPVTSTQEGGAP